MDPLVRHYSHINFISQTSSDFNFASPPPGQMSRPSASENGKVLSYLGTAVRVGFGNRPIQKMCIVTSSPCLRLRFLGLVLVRLTVHSKCAKGRVEVHTREGLHSSGDTRSLMPKRFAVPDENVAFSSRASPLIS